MVAAAIPDLPGADLTLEELDLYRRIMAYRADEGLAAIPLSAALTATAGYHAHDTLYNIWGAGMVLPDGANLHSWSDAFYYSDHRDPAVMWDAPARIGVSYASAGYEISAAGYASIEGALAGWQSSVGHDSVIRNLGSWSSVDFAAIGVGVAWDPGISTYQGRIYHVWFGETPDPAGPPETLGTQAGEAISGTAFADLVRGLGGDDVLALGGGDDVGDGGAGNDTLRGNAGRDTLTGGDGADQLRGQKGGDHLDGGAHSDNLKGGGGNDTLLGDSGDDFLNGGTRSDSLEGGAGSDRLFGRSFADTLRGGDGDDLLNAGGDDDLLDGGSGNDRLKGGDGADVFFFSEAEATGDDVIVDFDPWQDILHLPGLSLDDLTWIEADAHLRLVWDDGSVLLSNVAEADLSDAVFDFGS